MEEVPDQVTNNNFDLTDVMIVWMKAKEYMHTLGSRRPTLWSLNFLVGLVAILAYKVLASLSQNLQSFFLT